MATGGFSSIQLPAAGSQGHYGLAIIISNDYNYSGSSMKPLTETHSDGDKMECVLREPRFNYIVWRYPNLSYTKMLQVLSEASRMQCPKSFCSLVIVFSGHGTADEDRRLSYIFTQDCIKFPVKNLVDPFMPQHSPLMATLPKVFLIDACLGDRDAHLFSVNVPVGKGIRSDPASCSVENKGGRPVQTIVVPPEGNCILAYSTSIGYQSYEVSTEGGVWLNAVSEKIRVKGHSESVGNVLSEVTGDLMDKYQEPEYRTAMTQPHFTSTTHGPVYLVPHETQPSAGDYTAALQGSSQRMYSYETPSQPSPLNSKGQHRGRLNNMEQTKQISRLTFEDLPKSKNGLFLAKVSFRYTATGEMLSFPSTTEKRTSKEAQEEAARVACKQLDTQARQVSAKSAVKRQSSGQPLAPVKQQSTDGRNPLQKLKEGCEAKKPSYTFEVKEERIPINQQFQFKATATVRDATGRILCDVQGSQCNSIKAAKHDAASKANARLGF